MNFKSTSISRIAVVGFGSQGKAHATRLKSSGFEVRVGLRSGSRRRVLARQSGLTCTTPRRTVQGCDVVALMVPDRDGTDVFASLAPFLSPEALVVFAAGYPLTFSKIPIPAGFDVVLVAPHGPGAELETGAAMSGFVGVAQDVTGQALVRAKAYATAIGLGPLVETTPEQEALGDLFGEQTLLCGGLVGLTSAVVRTMIRKGLKPQNAYFETIGQLRQLADLLERRGIDGFWDEISDCAAAGSAYAAPRLFDRQFDRRLEEIWDHIESGRFAAAFQRKGRPPKRPKNWDVLATIQGEKTIKGTGKKKKGGP